MKSVSLVFAAVAAMGVLFTTTFASAQVTEVTPTTVDEEIVYSVLPNDSLGQIGRDFGFSPQEILDANRFRNGVFYNTCDHDRRITAGRAIQARCAGIYRGAEISIPRRIIRLEMIDIPAHIPSSAPVSPSTVEATAPPISQEQFEQLLLAINEANRQLAEVGQKVEAARETERRQAGTSEWVVFYLWFSICLNFLFFVLLWRILLQRVQALSGQLGKSQQALLQRMNVLSGHVEILEETLTERLEKSETLLLPTLHALDEQLKRNFQGVGVLDAKLREVHEHLLQRIEVLAGQVRVSLKLRHDAEDLLDFLTLAPQKGGDNGSSPSEPKNLSGAERWPGPDLSGVARGFVRPSEPPPPLEKPPEG